MRHTGPPAERLQKNIVPNVNEKICEKLGLDIRRERSRALAGKC